MVRTEVFTPKKEITLKIQVNQDEMVLIASDKKSCVLREKDFYYLFNMILDHAK